MTGSASRPNRSSAAIGSPSPCSWPDTCGGYRRGGTGARLRPMVRAALECAAGGARPGPVTAEVPRLLEGGLKAMSVSKLKTAAVFVGVLLFGLGEAKGGDKPAAGPLEKHALRHKDAVTAVVLGRDFVAAGDAGGTLNLWDVRTGKVRETLIAGPAVAGPGGLRGATPAGIDALGLSPAGDLLYIVSQGRD